MARVTSKRQLTLPKVLADRYGIDPGDEVEWEAAGDAIRLLPSRRRKSESPAARLKLFDQATRRQIERQEERSGTAENRGWTREELYERRAR